MVHTWPVELSFGVISRGECQLLGDSHRIGATERVEGAAGSAPKKEIMEPVPTPSEIDPACGGDPRSSIVSRSRVGPDIDTRALDWEVNGEEQSAPQPVVLL